LWENILIGLSGIPLGLLGYYFADPIPLVIDFDLARVLASSFVVIFYVGLLEEIIFRGLILHTLKDCYGNVGILLSTGIYTILFSSYHSIEGILLMGIVSLLYSWHVLESKSILAVTISHIFMIGGMVILWPIVF
jgi:membrane protease YdiL (CAAX protease family)